VYYWLALRNKVFHYWNRFYLMGAVVLSITLPLLRIPILVDTNNTTVHAIPLVKVMNSGDIYVEQMTSQTGYMPGPSEVIIFTYLCISLVFLIFLIRTFIKIKQMLGHYEIIPMNGISILNTSEPGTPFSFMKYIFWNQSIPADSPPGSQILKHEIVHVQQKHTYDKIFLQIVHILFWINPVFWLIRKEIVMIHEFIADKEAIENSDTSAFAAMILQAAYPGYQFSVSNYFFHSPVKRRLKMLIQSSNPRQSYITRLLALPLLVLIAAGFTLKTVHKKDHPVFPENRVYTVVIDAGHGGTDDGARAADGSVEKNFTLAIAQKMKALNSHPQINLVLTREDDRYQPVTEKLSKTLLLKPDVFLALHINQSPGKEKKGFEIFISNKSNSQNISLGAAIVNEISTITTIDKELKTRTHKNIYLLDAPEVSYAAALVECGFITNRTDLLFLQEEKNQELIAEKLLKGIERFISAGSTTSNSKINSQSDTIPPPKSKIVLQSPTIKVEGQLYGTVNPLIIINGRETPIKEMNDKIISADSIEIYDKNDPKAISLYGQKAIDGVMIYYNAKITEGKKVLRDTVPKGVKSIDITESGEVIVIFNNGKAEKMSAADAQRQGYLPLAMLDKQRPSNLMDSTIHIKGLKPDPLLVIDGIKQQPGSSMEKLLKDLNPDDIESITVLKDATATAIYGEEGKNGVILITTKKATSQNKWVEKGDIVVQGYPLSQKPIAGDSMQAGKLNGVKVEGYPIFKKTDEPPVFPKGDLVGYIREQINSRSNLNRDELKGQCKIEFIIGKDGFPYNYKWMGDRKTMNFKLADLVAEIISKGPLWSPAKQNGKQVSAFQTISFSLE
jgi:TonB-dependent SusC/RagA subfamily outer membrane receptor